MKRKLASGVAVLLIFGVTYAAWPFWSAWTLREAIRKGDTATIERRIEWDSVRATLKDSIARQAQLLPEVNAAGEAIRPTLWQRVKTAFGQSMLDRFIESYVTPQGLPQLFTYKKTYREKIKGEPDEAALGYRERLSRFWSRVHRAEFQSLTRVEIEMSDKDNPDRRFASTFDLQGLEWKLVALKVIATEKGSSIGGRQLFGSNMPAVRLR